MLASALFFALLTGLTWSAIGIVLSRCAKKDFGVIPYSLIQSFTAAILCFVLYADFGQTPNGADVLRLAAVILSAAILNAFAQYAVKCAMAKGNPTPVWAIAQAAMLFPFLSGLIFFHGKANLLNWGGLFFLFAGVFLPAVKASFRGIRQWFLPAMISLFFYGTLLSLYLIPSHLSGFSDPASLRPSLVCFGNCTGWALVAACFRTREPIRFTRAAVLTAIAMAVIHTFGVKTFFYALDNFSRMDRGGLAFPLMQGINLAGFGIYSLIFLKEKRTVTDVLSVLLILAGILLLGIG